MQVQASRAPGYTAQQWDRRPVLPVTVAAVPVAAQQSLAEMQQLLHESLNKLRLVREKESSAKLGLVLLKVLTQG